MTLEALKFGGKPTNTVKTAAFLADADDPNKKLAYSGTVQNPYITNESGSHPNSVMVAAGTMTSTS